MRRLEYITYEYKNTENSRKVRLPSYTLHQREEESAERNARSGKFPRGNEVASSRRPEGAYMRIMSNDLTIKLHASVTYGGPDRTSLVTPLYCSGVIVG